MTGTVLTAIVVLSLYWCFALALYVPASPGGAALFAGLGLLLLWRSASRSEVDLPRPSRAIACVMFAALAVGVIGFPAAWKVGPAVALAGLLGWLVEAERRSKPRPVWRALCLGGLVLIVQGAVVPAYISVFSTEHQLAPLRWPIYAILLLFGQQAAVGPEAVYAPIMRALHAFPATSERLALLPLSLMFVGLIVAVGASLELRRRAFRTIALAVPICLVYALLRYAVVITAYLYLMHRMSYTDETNRVDVFWDPWWTAVTFVPLAWLLALAAPRGARLDWFHRLVGRQADGTRYLVLMAALALLSAAAITAAVGLPEPSVRKAGRVLVDEYHSDWEKTTRAYDTKWYGHESGYNYYCIYDYLSRHFRTARLEEPITSASLASCDVLILKIPTKAFSDREVEEIVEFVRRGGGVFFIGEHTNVFGSGVYLNEVAERFGFRFRHDCLFDTQRKFEQVYRPMRFLRHPIVQNFDLFFFQVSASIRPPWFGGERVIVGKRLKALSADYHAQNFYPQVVDRSDMDFGPFVEMWGRSVGKGRILAFADSTCFSNFCTFQPGKPELFLASVEWLNHRNRWGYWKCVWAAIGVVALVGALVLVGRSKNALGTASLMVFLLAGAVPLFAGAARWINRETHPMPLPRQPLLRVYFEREHCDYELPIEGFVKQADKGYDIFYQWVMRLGVFAFVGWTLEESVEQADAIVLIRPNRTFEEREVEALADFVRRGGGLLILDSPKQRGRPIRGLLSAFGLKIERKGQPYRGLVRAGDSIAFNVEGAWPVSGGEPLALGSGGQVLASRVRYGNGIVVIATFADQFVDRNMGSNWGFKPDAALLQVYEMEFLLLREVLGEKLASAARAPTAVSPEQEAPSPSEPAAQPHVH